MGVSEISSTQNSKLNTQNYAGTRLSEFFFRRHWLLWAILGVNFFSSLYGYYWYHWQLMATTRWLWLFVPDCPLAATLMAVALGIYLFTGQRWSWFHFLTYAILLKYGFWTVFVFTLYWAAGGKSYSFEYIMLFVSHIGMLAEGMVFLGSVPRLPRYWWLAAGWSAVDVYFDYFYPIRIAGRRAVGVYPYLPNDFQRPVILVMTLAITFSFILAGVAAAWRARNDASKQLDNR